MALRPEVEAFAADRGEVGALLCHGFTGSPASLRPWAEHLADADVTVRLPRLPGHGTRWQDANPTHWEDWYGEIERAFDELRGRCTAVFAMGLSMGATLALRLAQQHGAGVAGLVLVNPHLVTTRWDARYLLPVLRYVVPSFPAIGDDIKRPGVTEHAYPRTPLRAAWSVLQLGKLVHDDLGSVTQPVLLFGSREDHVVPTVNQQMVRDEVGSSDVEYVVLDNSYHVATLDNDAPLIFERSVEFVRAHAPSRSAG